MWEELHGCSGTDRPVRIDLNADVGEGSAELPGVDADLIPLVTSVNIACGAHAGNESVMAATVALAHANGVAVGAHPSLDDREHFGRREYAVTPAQVERLIRDQVGALIRIASAQGVAVRHVKAHGALYNMAARDPALADAIAAAARAINPQLVLVGPSGSQLTAAGERAGLRTASEVFADRSYHADGSLVPRSSAGAIIDDPAVVSARAVEMVKEGCVTAVDGSQVFLRADTICLHSDTPGAVERARHLRSALLTAGIRITAWA
jgi:UPF0271 protein